MPAAEDDPANLNLYGEEDEEDDDEEDDTEDEEEEEEEDDDEEEDEVVAEAPDPSSSLISNPQKRKADDAVEDLNSPSPSTTSSYSDQNPQNPNPTNPSLTSAPLTSAPPDPPPPSFSTPAPVSPDHHKRLKTATATATATAVATPIDDSRRLFQRLWTDEDEIGLLQGFLEYTSQRGRGRGVFHHDTAPFYDQIKTRLQLDFNKNQLVEKLRRLKKKYRNVVNRIDSGRDFSFKSPHEQATFEISRQIWSTAASAPVDDDEDGNSHPNAAGNKVPRSRRRGRKRLDGGTPSSAPPTHPAPMEDKLPNFPHTAPPHPTGGAPNSNVSNVIEDTVRSCLSPLFKELLYCAINGPCNSAVGGVALNPLPLNFGGNSVNLSSSEAVDERWRKQQILELEVYSKRLELVQEQIKSSLEDLRSMGS